MFNVASADVCTDLQHKHRIEQHTQKTKIDTMPLNVNDERISKGESNDRFFFAAAAAAANFSRVMNESSSMHDTLIRIDSHNAG